MIRSIFKQYNNKGGEGMDEKCPYFGGDVIKRTPPGHIFQQTPAGMSLVWGKLVHVVRGNSISFPEGLF